MKGKLITFEGIEGAGKSTQIDTVADALTAQNIPFITTREPGGTALAEKIRELLISTSGTPLGSTAELLLMFAGRAQHLEEVIWPALEQGTWVLCDRFTDATYAYQGGGRELPTCDIETLELLVQKQSKPDLTLLFDLPVELGLQRAAKRGALDRFEQEEIEFFQRVRLAYLQQQEKEPSRFVTINAAEPLEDVTSAVRHAVTQAIGLWKVQ